MSSRNNVITLQDVTKHYRLFNTTGDRLKQAVSLGLSKYYKEHTALKNVSFSIKQGETVGIIGKNGAGKSTLLQLICGILKPTSGSVEINGRVSAMLELGAGFHPEFTGRENVFFQGSLMGLSESEVKDKMKDIEAFADIGEYIDQPVRTYSSGMFVRLGFAVATHVDPDILVIDEVLAVGDAVFQQKCIDLVNKLQSSGITIIVVSHNPYHIERMCHKAAILHSGSLSDLKPVTEILSDYYELVQKELTQSSIIVESEREGSGDVVFDNVSIETENAYSNEPLSLVAHITAKKKIDNVIFRFELYSSENELVTQVSSVGFTENQQFYGKHQVIFTMDNCLLTSGWYYINAIIGSGIVRFDTWQRAIDFKVYMRDKKIQSLTMDKGVFITPGQWKSLQL